MLKVSRNRRYLVRDDGTPWFYLADTAWELFHRTTREEAEIFLADRAAKGYTVIQAVVLAELDGLHDTNVYGHRPLQDNDPTKPNEDYMAYVDWVVKKANSLGMYIAMLPTWGDKWNKCWGVGPEIFTPENAHAWGRYLGARYRDADIIWILGGDRPVQSPQHAEIIDQMAKGVHEGDGGRHLMTFHSCGQQTSAQYFHARDWLDFNMYQTGHTFGRDNWRSITDDFLRLPVKPCLDGEPGYEHHPSAFNIANGLMNDHDCRNFAYWSLFAGACGHTYGCHEIWQFYTAAREPKTSASMDWHEAMKLPGSGQMQHARKLIESGPFFDRVPDLNLVADDDADPRRHVQACRASDDRYALVYFPVRKTVTLRVQHLGPPALSVRWYDALTGQWTASQRIDATREQKVTPPENLAAGAAWVATAE